MRKTVLAALAASLLYGASGEDVYKNKCMACHKVIDVKARQAKMQQLSPEKRKEAMKKFMRTLVAPPMNKVSARLKYFYPQKKEFVAFVVDYITSPSRQKGHCMPMAYKKFGVMPPIGKRMSKTQKEAVANWLYDNFDEKWQEMQACAADGDKGKKMMKCGAGKCGMGMPKAKPAMKCGAGKCGGM